MGINLAGGFGAGAASGALEDLLKQKFLEQIQRQQLALQQARLSEDARQANMADALGHRSAATAEGNLGVRRDEFTQGVREYDEAAPIRAANVRLAGAQAGELERKPKAEQDARDFRMTELGLQHGYDVNEQRVAGEEARKTEGVRGVNALAAARIRTRPRIQKTAGVNADGKAVTKFIDIDSGETVHEELAAPTADERNRGASTGRAMPVIGRASELSSVINTKYGVNAKMLGSYRELKARVNEDPDVAEYVSLVEGFTPLIARAAGHTGVLTEQDVERTVQLLPKPGDSADLAARKLRNLNSLLGGSGATPPPTGDNGKVTITSITPVQ